MKQVLLGIIAVLFASNVAAGLWCKNSAGDTLVWKIGQPRPENMANFGSDVDGLVCMVNSQIYRDLAAGAFGFRDFPCKLQSPRLL